MIDFNKSKNQSLLQLDELIRQGRAHLATGNITQLAQQRLPREDKLLLANLARRSGLSDISLRLLNRIVRSESPRAQGASNDEKIEYAAALIQIGVIREARSLLASTSTDPDALLQLSFSHFREWDYKTPLTLLNRALSLTPSSRYSYRVLQLNKAAALVHLKKSTEAHTLLQELLAVTQEDSFRRLHLSVLQLMAENAIHREDWSNAEAALKQIESGDKQESAVQQLYVRRWRWVLKAGQGANSHRDLLLELNALRRRAWQLGEFETVRELDRQQARLDKNPTLFRKIHLGTPHAAYRSDLEEEYSAIFGEELKISHEGFLRINQNSKALGSSLSPAESLQTSSFLKAGQSLHTALRVLCEDFYSPPSLASFHEKVFETVHYNPHSSPNRVHQLLRRLRDAFEEKKIPLHITVDRKLILLSSHTEVSIPLNELRNKQYPSSRLKDLLNQFRDDEFNVVQAAQWLKTSTRTASRLLTEGVALQILRPIGEGRRRRYTPVS